MAILHSPAYRRNPSLAEMTPGALVDLTLGRMSEGHRAILLPHRQVLVGHAAKLLREAKKARLEEGFGADIGLDLATRAHTWVSHDPEGRGARVIQGYKDHMEKMQSLLGEDFGDYRRGYAAKMRAWLGAVGQTASTMVTGGSNFNVRRAEKRNATEHNRWKEVEAFHEAFLRGKRRREWREARKDGGVLRKLEADLASRIALQERMKKVNAVLRKVKVLPTDPDELRALAERLAEQLDYDPSDILRLLMPKWGPIGYASFNLQNNLASIKRVEERIQEERAKLERQDANVSDFERTIELPTGTVRVLYNRDNDRIQIFADRNVIPNDAYQRSGWKWSPREGARQRQLTDNAIASANNLLGLPFGGYERLPTLANAFKAQVADAAREEAEQGDDIPLDAETEADITAEARETMMPDPEADNGDMVEGAPS